MSLCILQIIILFLLFIKVYVFGDENELPDDEGERKKILGSKGANLMKMAALGLAVPPGLTITTEVYESY
jgi:pyruvate,orthophosphate dikinase